MNLRTKVPLRDPELDVTLKASMLRVLTLGLLYLPLFGQTYIKVHLVVAAPDSWHETISDNLATKLNAVPDVMVSTEKAPDSSFTVLVDVNSIEQEGKAIGYSMMAIIYGTYDQAFLKDAFAEGEKTIEAEEQEAMKLMKYSLSGNVFLCSWVHTHGALTSISDAYDEIVGKLKSKGLPEYRKFVTMVNKLAESTKIKQKARPIIRRYE